MLDVYRFVSILRDELYVIDQEYTLYLNTPLGKLMLNDHLVWKILEMYSDPYISITIERYSIELKEIAHLNKLVPIILIHSTRTSSMQEYVKVLAQQIDYEFRAFEKQQGESDEQ